MQVVDTTRVVHKPPIILTVNDKNTKPELRMTDRYEAD